MRGAKPTLHFALFAFLMSCPLNAVTCESLTSLSLANTTITAAAPVAAGAFLPEGPPPGPMSAAIYKSLPAFCRVQGVISPTKDSHIEFEVWMPLSGWNGRYLGVGNGGLAGYLAYTWGRLSANVPGLTYLVNGYATSSTDTGHKGGENDTEWAQGHPEKVIDYGYRGIHETAEKSKAIIEAFYGRPPKHSYFSSCSNGGRQGLMEAQRFPADYDGIIAGAPVTSWTRLVATLITRLQAAGADPSRNLPGDKLPAIEKAALAACDAQDGVKDGLIDDPRKCEFDPGALLCTGTESASCLTASQVSVLKSIYGGLRNSKGDRLYPGLLPGAETGPNGWALRTDLTGPMKDFGIGFGQNLLSISPSRNFQEFNLDRDLSKLDGSIGKILNVDNPELKSFRRHGGKLLLFHGWGDAALPPAATIDYYERIITSEGRNGTGSFVRLYMAAGVQHCGSGPGPNVIGPPMIEALEHWVEDGIAPSEIVATKYTENGPSKGVARTRPLCPYPQLARYKGSGSIDEATNFVCRAP